MIKSTQTRVRYERNARNAAATLFFLHFVISRWKTEDRKNFPFFGSDDISVAANNSQISLAVANDSQRDSSIKERIQQREIFIDDEEGKIEF